MRALSDRSTRNFVVALAVAGLLPCAAHAADCGGASISARFSDATALCGARDAGAPVATARSIVDTPQTVAIRIAGPAATRRSVRRGRVAKANVAPVAASHDRLVHAVGRQYRVDPQLLAAMMHAESRGRPGAVSPKGALGLMQVMPATARSMGVNNPRTMLSDPVLALSTGALYLKTLQAQLGNNVPLVVAAYNAGPGAVRKYRGIPKYRETQGYVSSVMGRYVASRRR